MDNPNRLVLVALNGSDPQPIQFDARTKLSALRRHVVEQLAPQFDPSPYKWTMRVDGVVVVPMEAVNRVVEAGMNVELVSSSSAAAATAYKRTRPATEDDEQDKKLAVDTTTTRGFTGLSDYHLTTALLRIFGQGERAFLSERQGNGVTAAAVFHIMGHISTKIGSIKTHFSVSEMDVATQLRANVFAPCVQGKQVTLVPHLTPCHVALVCTTVPFGQAKMIHLDPSSSIAAPNGPMFAARARFATVSYTYVNYQMYDDAATISFDGGGVLAGGNCALFMGLNAISILTRYDPAPVRFPAFWAMLGQVMRATEASLRVQVARDVMRRVSYMARARGEQAACADFAKYWIAIDVPVPVFEQLIINTCGRWVAETDFSADAIMLRYFIDANIGFHQVRLLGNVFRAYLRDMMEHGFVTGQLARVGNELRARASAVVLSAMLIVGQITKLTPDELERIIDAFLDIGDNGDLEEDQIAKYEKIPRLAARVVLRSEMGVKDNDARSDQVLAQQYLLQLDERKRAREASASLERRERERLAIASGDVVHERVGDSRLHTFRLMSGGGGDGKLIQVHLSRFEALSGQTLLLRSVKDPSRRTWVRVGEYHDAGPDDIMVPASIYALLRTDRVYVERLADHGTLPLPSSMKLRFYGATLPPPLTEAQLVQDLGARVLHGWPAVSVGEEIVVSEGVTVRVENIMTSGAAVREAMLPFDAIDIAIVMEYESPALVGCTVCGTASSTFVCSNIECTMQLNPRHHTDCSVCSAPATLKDVMHGALYCGTACHQYFTGSTRIH